MFTNLMLFTLAGDMPTFAELAEAMDRSPFVDCGPTQPQSYGWVPARDEAGGALLEAVGGQWVAVMQIETRALPGAVVKRRVAAMSAEVEKATGRKPKGKALRELKYEATRELLPKSFTRQVKVPVWIDPKRRMAAFDTSSATRADVTALALIDAAPKVNLHALRTKFPADHLMTSWVHGGETGDDFDIDRRIELRGSGENPPVLTLAGCDVTGGDVRARIAQGMRVSKLSMTYKGRVSFVLHENGTMKGVTVLDVDVQRTDGGEADKFDADVAIITGELAPMIDALVAELGGVAALPIEAAANAEEGGTAPAGEPPPDTGDASTDPLFDQAVAVVRQHKRASISIVQRYLRIGYNRAARLLERMESDGVVTAQDSSGNRKLIDAEARADA